MRNPVVVALFTIAVAAPLHAVEPNQSYFTYDDGGTVVRQGENGAEIEGRVNLPVYPGDQVITSRRGRTEIRLSDGNVIALDRATTVIFRSILDSYEGEASQTIAELQGGHVAALRTPAGHDLLRIDTPNASYVALEESSYAVSSEGGNDRVLVFNGTIEVRTPQRTTRVHAGDEAHVDNQGLSGLVSDSMSGDEFERWFIRRGERYGTASSRYLDQSIAYADEDLADNGQWQYVSSVNSWAWRPYVSAGWRPYLYGSWSYGPDGYLTWASYEPWGWVPYHYGRWAYDPFYGWVWMPGSGYAPAWVYWAYGDGYVGWAPSGWWDCYKPYYSWCYRPYSHDGHSDGYGFYGRVNTAGMDLRPWTFVNPHQMVATRIDRAALSSDVIKDRLARTGGGYTTVGSTVARFTRNELKDPNAAVNVIARRGVGGGTGKDGPGSSTVADMTPFFRRDPDLSANVRDKVVRRQPVDANRGNNGNNVNGAANGGGTIVTGGVAPISGGGLAPISGGSVAPIGGGALAPVGSGSVAPVSGDRVGRIPPVTVNPTGTNRSGGRLGRGENPSSTPSTTTPAPAEWRTVHPSQPAPAPAPSTAPSSPTTTPRVEPVTPPARTPDRSHADQTWRGRAIGRQPSGETPQPAASTGSAATTPAPVQPVDYRSTRGSDVPRRIIERIGGARLMPGDSAKSGSGSTPSSTSTSSSGSRPSYTPPPPRESAPAKVDRPASTEKSSPPPAKHDSPPPKSNNDGAKVHREHE